MQLISGSDASSGDNHDELREAWRRRSKPDNEIPVTVGSAILLGRTDELAVAISDLRVYRNGVEFTLSARGRGRVLRQGGLYEGLNGHSHHRHRDPAGPFLLGFEFSDGRSVTNVANWPPAMPDHDDGDSPRLSGGDGGGNDRSAEHALFLSPLPPGDTLTIIAAWPSFGLAETRHTVDAAAIRRAAERVIRLWPQEPDDDGEPDPPPAPAVPPGSWFERK